MQKFTLEKSRVFPYAAWSVILGFTLFVFHLTLNLQAAVTDLQRSTDELEAAVHAPPHATTTPVRN